MKVEGGRGMEEVKKETTATTVAVNKEELQGLSNTQIALKLYLLVDEENKFLDDFMEIGAHFKSIAANKKKWNKS